ncbi:hypothetical protein Bca52824_009103 [Brassica carinata]|uniref:Meiosis-specific protein ASY3-like coiled-coil domain-containing protein n=1 Tax=Brassica carinata TaxID=52824 RepID=A0A8X7WC30_BRACI|nr:hypothetical protein Bca52824_009103 [Brassica carinata]
MSETYVWKIETVVECRKVQSRADGILKEESKSQTPARSESTRTGQMSLLCCILLILSFYLHVPETSPRFSFGKLGTLENQHSFIKQGTKWSTSHQTPARDSFQNFLISSPQHSDDELIGGSNGKDMDQSPERMEEPPSAVFPQKVTSQRDGKDGPEKAKRGTTDVLRSKTWEMLGKAWPETNEEVDFLEKKGDYSFGRESSPEPNEDAYGAIEDSPALAHYKGLQARETSSEISKRGFGSAKRNLTCKGMDMSCRVLLSSTPKEQYILSKCMMKKGSQGTSYLSVIIPLRWVVYVYHLQIPGHGGPANLANSEYAQPPPPPPVLVPQDEPVNQELPLPQNQANHAVQQEQDNFGDHDNNANENGEPVRGRGLGRRRRHRAGELGGRRGGPRGGGQGGHGHQVEQDDDPPAVAPLEAGGGDDPPAVAPLAGYDDAYANAGYGHQGLR